MSSSSTRRGRSSIAANSVAHPWKFRPEPSSPCRMITGGSDDAAARPPQSISMKDKGAVA
eukprot:scaffold241_cov242-Pinguiococcus_pyrenoidosus.AAC.31